MFTERLKKALAVFCLAAILFSCFQFAALAAYENTYKNTGDQALDLVGVAKTQLGYTEGSNGYTKYGEYYGSPYIDWCGAFIVWCANQAGIGTSVIPKNASSNGLKDFFAAKNRYYLSYGHGGSYTPKAGDIAFMSASNKPGDITHVGIVAAFADGTITTVEGNYSNRVTQVSYPESTLKIVGFASPLYGSRVGYYKLNASMNLRSGPSTENSILTLIPGGTVVTVTKIKGDWGYVTYNGVSGWMNLDYSTFQRGLDTAEGTPISMPKDALFLAADISQWNNPSALNWAQLKASGVEAVIIRAAGRGYGYARQLYRDTAFVTHYRNAAAAGMHIGVYFYSYAMTAEQAREEARLTMDILKENDCVLDMPVFIDIEDHAPEDYSHERAGKAACTAVVNAFCDEVEKGGYYPGVYCNKYFAENLLDASAFANKAVWIAHYGVSKCGYSGKYDMWQYTDSGSVSGYAGSIDLNYVYTDLPGLITKDGITGSFGKHVPGEWEITKAPTCAKEGKREVKCVDCGVTLISEVLERAHKESEHYIQLSKNSLGIEDTVNDDLLSTLHSEKERNYADVYLNSYEEYGGTMITFCTECGKILSAAYSYGSEAHSHTETTTKAATCKNEGLVTVTCTDCGKILSQTVLPFARHTPGESAGTGTTCTEEGKRNTACAVCGKTIRTELTAAASAHRFGPAVVTRKVTLKKAGVVQYTCTVCGYTQTEKIPSPVFGDLNGDGEVTTMDARTALRAAIDLETLTDVQTVAGDITNTGAVEVGDARFILRIAVGLNKAAKLREKYYGF